MRDSIKMERILKNCIQCKLCGDVIESKSVHDFKICSCGACGVDGGLEYIRRMADSRDSYIEMSIVEKAPESFNIPK